MCENACVEMTSFLISCFPAFFHSIFITNLFPLHSEIEYVRFERVRWEGERQKAMKHGQKKNRSSASVFCSKMHSPTMATCTSTVNPSIPYMYSSSAIKYHGQSATKQCAWAAELDQGEQSAVEGAAHLHVSLGSHFLQQGRVWSSRITQELTHGALGVQR